MIQQCINVTNETFSLDPSEWLKQFINNTMLISPIDCNNLVQNPGYSGEYMLDELTNDEIMNAWNILLNTTAFNQFWSDTQQEYVNNVPANWNQYFDNNCIVNCTYTNTSERNATFNYYKHIADLMIYLGAQTQMNVDRNPVVNGTNFGLGAFWQNYNEDWDYYKKYGEAFYKAAFLRKRTP